MDLIYHGNGAKVSKNPTYRAFWFDLRRGFYMELDRASHGNKIFVRIRGYSDLGRYDLWRFDCVKITQLA